jgi:IclR family transcriptional regulator, pca regulon regulatory protein
MGRSPRKQRSPASKNYIHALARGLDIICAFDAGHPRMTLTQLAARSGATQAMTRRLVTTLVTEHYLTTDGEFYALAPRTLDLGFAHLMSPAGWNIAINVLTDLAREVGDTCSVGMLDGDEVVHVACATTRRVVNMDLQVGNRLPAFPTSVGRVLLAQLPEDELDALMARRVFPRLTPHTVTDPGELRAILRRTKVQGWSITNQELELGLLSIAAPLWNLSGQVTAAINIWTHAERMTPRQFVDRVLPALLRAAERIGSVGGATIDQPRGGRMVAR